MAGLFSADPKCTCEWMDKQNGAPAQVTNIMTHIQTCIVAVVQKNGLENYKAGAYQISAAKNAVQRRRRTQRLPESHMSSTGSIAESSFLSLCFPIRHDGQQSTEEFTMQAASSASIEASTDKMVGPSYQTAENQNSEPLKWKVGSEHPKANAAKMSLRRIRIPVRRSSSLNRGKIGHQRWTGLKARCYLSSLQLGMIL